VYVDNGTFSKIGGTIYGWEVNGTLRNIANNGCGYGHAVYGGTGKIRDTTAGPGVNLDSAKTKAEGGGWE
jgi:hypothetical protein